MGQLFDFKPLKRVSLPDIGDIECRGLTLVVGPNSAGKSQLLQDLYHSLAGDIRKLVVAKEIAVAKPEYDPFLEQLETEGYFKKSIDDGGVIQLVPTTMYLGTGAAVAAIPIDNAANWYRDYDSNIERRRTNPFLNHFGRLLVSALFLDRRLTSLGATGLIDFETQPPQHDLHALHLSDDAKASLYSEILDSFGKAIWPDTSRGGRLCLRVSDEHSIPSAEDRLSFKKMAEYRTIETEGDGMKSYVGICVSILLGRRPVTLVDEPEMCLHPPQAYNLGRFIGRHGASKDSATFISTHSSHVLRGVLQSTKDLQIVRLTRRGAEFRAHLVPADVLNAALSKPTLRGETILDGIFSQGVVVVESDTDRLVYNTTLETIADEERMDIHFAPVGGTDGLAGTCSLYKALQIPVAIVADLDVIADMVRLRRILNVMTDKDTAASLMRSAEAVLEELRKLPPSIEPDVVKARIDALASLQMRWERGDDAQVRKELSKLAKELDRMRKLKRGGVAALPAAIGTSLQALLSTLMKVGIFLVPVGELEDWLSNEQIVASRENKWAWANEASLAIQAKGACSSDVWDFMRSVASYLREIAA